MSSDLNTASISSIPFFKDLSAPDLMTILEIVSIKKIDAGDNLFTQNDPSDGLYVLSSGKLQVYIFSGHTGGTPKVLAELNPGQYVGEMGLLDGQNRSASVKAIIDSEVLLIPTAGFAVLLQAHRKIAKVVVDCLCDMINNQKTLVINSEKAILVRNKGLAPTLTNMRALCAIMREHNRRTAIDKK